MLRNYFFLIILFNFCVYSLNSLTLKVTYSQVTYNVTIQTQVKSLFWLHIEKTGTSIGMTFFLFSCPIVFDVLNYNLTKKNEAVWDTNRLHKVYIT